MKNRLMLIVFSAIAGIGILTGNVIRNDVRLADGRTVGIDHLFVDGDNPTFKCTGVIPMNWRLELYTDTYTDEDGVEHDTFIGYESADRSRSFKLDFENVEWRTYVPYKTIYPKIFPTPIHDAYFKGRLITCDNDGNEMGIAYLTFNLLPSMPELSNIYYTYSIDKIEPDGFLILKGDWVVGCSGRRCSIMLLGRSRHWGGFFDGNHLFTMREEIINLGDSQMDFNSHYNVKDVNWGVWAHLISANKYGSTVSADTICTTDCITDPDILDRIEEWRRQQAGVGFAHADAPLFQMDGTGISVSAPADMVRRVSIADCHGRMRQAEFSDGRIDISDLAPGFHILFIETKDNKRHTLKFLKP